MCHDVPPGRAKPLPPTSPSWDQGLLGEQALPPASAQEAAGWASLAPSSSPHSSYLLSGSKHFCSFLYSNPRSSKQFFFNYFFFFCPSLEPLAWLSLHRTGREAPAKRAIPPAMCRAPVCIFCKGFLSMLRLKHQQFSCRRSLLSHQNKLHLSPAVLAPQNTFKKCRAIP